MLRAAQMMMGSLLTRLLLGRGWRLPFPSDTDNKRRINALKVSVEYRQLLRCFADRPGPPCLFSVHHLAAAGKPSVILSDSLCLLDNCLIWCRYAL